MADVTIAVVDDDDAVRVSTCALLRSVGYNTIAFASGDSFLQADPQQIHALVLDVRMPGTDGVRVLAQWKQAKRQEPVLMLSGHGDIGLAVQAMRLGAYDFLEKPYDATDLLERLERALQSTPSDQGVAFDENAAQLLALLTPRQLEVLRGIAAGLPNKLIAHKLDLSTRTVESYRAQLLERLRARNSAEAVKVALMGGLNCA